MPRRGWYRSSRATGTGSGVDTSATIASEFADTIAVGTVYELDGLPDGPTPVVLTPTLEAPEDISPILTVGSLEHVAALGSWPGRVVVKLASSMRRFGGAHRTRREGTGERARDRRRVDPSATRR